MTFAQRLKELRAENGVTQTQLAEKIGLSHGCIAMLEVEKRAPTGNTLSLLADFFGCSVDYLLGREDDFGNVATPGVELPADEQELLTNFRTLPREEKVQARSYVRYLAERRAPGNKHA